MPRLQSAKPKISVRLYKTISRKTVDGVSAVSARYEGKDEFIDLTPYLGVGSSVVTHKSVREPAGAFSITFSDRPHKSNGAGPVITVADLETVYGLVEPMDVIEIRMWGGTGPAPSKFPIKMRGFVSRVGRQQGITPEGKPVRQVVITGFDYGKIWQTYQVLYLPAFADGKSLLTTYNMMDLFGIEAKAAIPAGEFVRMMVTKIINPHIKSFMPENSEMPKEIQTGDSISVKHGVISSQYQNEQGSIYDILSFYGDVGIWNELYLEDREDGVHCVYRATPAMHITKPKDAKDRKIQDDAPDPVYVDIPDSMINSHDSVRSDDGVANFYWVNNQKYDLIDDISRKLFALSSSDKTVSLDDYPNSAPKYYGVRVMQAETQQGGDDITSETGGLSDSQHDKRSGQIEDWITRRRTAMMQMNRDNVVLERGSARIKGGPMRADGKESMKAGDYAVFKQGTFSYPAYVVEIVDEFMPFNSYTTTLSYERGEGFVTRAQANGGRQSPWLSEMATRGDS